MRLWRWAATAVFIPGYFVSWFSLIFLAERFHIPAPPFAAFPFLVLLLAIGIAVHEAGHLFAASWAGLQPQAMRILRIELRRRRSGWRWRWSRRVVGPAGLVVAYPVQTDAVAVRRAYLWMIAGGPLANFATAVVCACGIALTDGAFAPYAWTAGLSMNLALGLSNALPASGRHYPHDGLVWWQWFRMRDPDAPALARLRVIALSLRGVRASELPVADIARTVDDAPSGPIFAAWLRLAAASDLGDWAGVAREAAALSEQFEAMPAEIRKAFDGFEPAVRFEAVCAEVLGSGDGAALDGMSIDAALEWNHPGFDARLRGLRAALAGDVSACTAALADMRRAADDSIERSMPTNIAALERAINALLATRRAAVEAT